MTTQDVDTARLVEVFGAVAVRLLHSQPTVHAWRLNFLANFFTGPFYRDLDEHYGLSRPEYVILLGLSQQSGLLARDICLATGLPKNSISRAVTDLLRRGLVQARTVVEDRRAKRLFLTAAGAELFAKVLPLAEARQAAMRSVFSPDEAEQFDGLLIKLIEGMPTWVDPR